MTSAKQLPHPQHQPLPPPVTATAARPALFRSGSILLALAMVATVHIVLQLSMPLTQYPHLVSLNMMHPSAMLRFTPPPLPPGINLRDAVHVKAHTLFTHARSLLANYSYSFADSTLTTPTFDRYLDYDTHVPVPVPPPNYPHLINAPDTASDPVSLLAPSSSLNFSKQQQQPPGTPLSLALPLPRVDPLPARVAQRIASLGRPLMHNPLTNKKFILFRAVGNDLPPRHAKGQVLTNIQFILDNEEKFADLDVRWYVNRILDEDAFLSVIDLLTSRNQTFVIDPFDTLEYAEIDFKLNGFEELDILRDPIFHPYSNATRNERRLLWDDVFAPKNHYIVHNNEARNAMLRLGFAAGADYVLPWDGNCFLTSVAWRNITSGIARALQRKKSSVSRRYYYVPMQRVTDNANLLQADYRPETIDEEPQLIFHKSATERFNESLRYGCAPKVALLSRLRVPGVWLLPSNATHECTASFRRSPSADVPLYQTVSPVGWTARLFSGMIHLEVEGAKRGSSRSNGVEFIAARASRRVATRLFNYTSGSSPLFYDVSALASVAEAYRLYLSSTSSTFTNFLSSSSQIYDNLRLFVNRHHHNNPHTPQYDATSTPLPLTVAELRLITSLRATADAEIRSSMNASASAAVTAAAESARTAGLNATEIEAAKKRALPRKLFGTVARDAAVHALAASITGRRVYAARSRALLRMLVSNEVVPAVGGDGAAGTCALLEAAKLLGLMQALDMESDAAVHNWARNRSEWMHQDTVAQLAYFGRASDGVAFELQMACIAAYLNDFVGVLRGTALARARMLTAFSGNVSAIWEDVDGGSRGLLTWIALAQVAERVGIDLWLFGTQEKHGSVCALREAVRLYVDDLLSGDSDEDMSVEGAALRRDVAFVASCVASHRLAEAGVSLWGNRTAASAVRDDHNTSRVSAYKPDVDNDCVHAAPALLDATLPFAPFWNLAWLPRTELNRLRKILPPPEDLCTKTFADVYGAPNSTGEDVAQFPWPVQTQTQTQTSIAASNETLPTIKRASFPL